MLTIVDLIVSKELDSKAMHEVRGGAVDMFLKLENIRGETVIEQHPTTAVPEPSTLTLFGLGLAGLGFARRKKA